MGIRLMIIELGKYNSAEELLIETRTTGSQVHVCYRNGDQSTSGTRAAVRMEVGGTGMRTGHRGAYKWVQIGNEHRGAGDECGAIKEALAFNNIEIE